VTDHIAGSASLLAVLQRLSQVLLHDEWGKTHLSSCMVFSFGNMPPAC
jgi:hypothetical protein